MILQALRDDLCVAIIQQIISEAMNIAAMYAGHLSDYSKNIPGEIVKGFIKIKEMKQYNE